MLLYERIRPGGLAYYFADEPLVGSPAGAPVGGYGGRVAERLGLLGRPVVRAELEAFASGRDPRDGTALGARQRAVVAYDVVFPVAKSISLVFGLGAPESRAAVLDAHAAARDAALEHLERTAALLEGRAGEGKSLLRTEGLLWASFCHHTSRSGDPHLHSHVVLVNRAATTTGWSAFSPRRLVRELQGTQWLYERALRAELTDRLGLGFRSRSFAGSDVIGVADAAIAHFSRRQQAIAAREVTLGVPDGPVATVINRPAKDPSRSGAALEVEWHERAASLGMVLSRPPFSGSDRYRRPTGGAARFEAALREAAERLGRALTPAELLSGALGPAHIAIGVAEAERALERVLSALVPIRPGPSRRETTYATQAVAAAIDREGALFLRVPSGAPAIEWLRETTCVVLDLWNDPVRTCPALHRAALEAHAEGRPLRAIGSNWRSASRFAAVTGIDASRLATTPLPRSGLVVLADAHRVPVASRLELVERALERDNAVVYCGHESLRPGPRRPLDLDAVPSPEATRRYGVAGIDVTLVPSPGAAFALLCAAASDGDAPARVIAGHIARALGLSAEAAPGRPLVVLGGRDLLPAGNWGAARAHVLVRPLGLAPDAERAFAYGVAVPAALRRRLGSPHPAVADRIAWGVRALSLAPERDLGRDRRAVRSLGAGLEVD